MSAEDRLATLLSSISDDERRLPPVDRWQPGLSGDIDIRIAANGEWYHEDGLIRRHELVKLFSSILRREGDDYFLVTPVEKWRIRVDDLPFVATSVERVTGQGGFLLLFQTNVDSQLVADAAHPVIVKTDPQSGEPRPEIPLRANLTARISRNAFYQLVDWAEQDGAEWWITSGAERFRLGSADL